VVVGIFSNPFVPAPSVSLKGDNVGNDEIASTFKADIALVGGILPSSIVVGIVVVVGSITGAIILAGFLSAANRDNGGVGLVCTVDDGWVDGVLLLAIRTKGRNMEVSSVGATTVAFVDATPLWEGPAFG
jgi:hypothetical protein